MPLPDSSALNALPASLASYFANIDSNAATVDTALTGNYKAGGTDVAVADGGTGASTAAGARTNLGLGTAAVAALIDDDTMATASATNVPSAESVKAYADGVASGGLIDIAKHTRTAGSFTLNSTSWADVNTGTDLVLTATTGDEVEVQMSAIWGSENVVGALDVATIVAGSPVNYFSTGTGTPATSGVQGWASESGTTDYSPITGGDIYTLQAGDISAGTVTLRLRYKTGTAANLTLFASTANRFRWWAKVLRV